MVYLDYSATTPVDDEVLDSFCKTSKNFVGNTNSLHKLGVESKKLETSATKQIANILGVLEEEIIYTSGSSESNNLALKGIAGKYGKNKKHIITTSLEHSSIYGPIGYLQKQGFEVDFVKTDQYGRVDIDDLKSLIKEDTILVSIASVNSETGVLQDVDKVGELLENYPNTFFHVDATQSIGKVKISLKNIDLLSFSAHKFYGLKGIGCLVKKKGISLETQIHGGKSTTNYRSGTPALPLIVSLAKALRLIDEKIEKNYNHVKELNEYIKEKLRKYETVKINSNEYSIPHILNISTMKVQPETMQHALEEFDIYISTGSACASNNSISKAVLEVTKSEEQAKHSIRISLSGITTKEDVDYFLKSFDECLKRLEMK